MRKLWLGVICLVLSCSAVSARNSAIIQNGVLDLRAWSWQKDGMVNLTGDWEFYWRKFYYPSFFKDTTGIRSRQFISVPSLVKGFGYATYHLIILCPSSHEQLAIKFLTLFINQPTPFIEIFHSRM